MNNLEQFESRIARLEKAIAVLTEVALDAKAYCWAIMSEMPDIPAGNAEARQKMEFRMAELMRDAKKDWRREIVQAGGLLPEENLRRSNP
jgi:hypothetical protein